MYLTKNQEKMLNGDNGDVIAKCMELIVKIGDANNASRLINIKSAQIAGVSYYTVGDPIFPFLEFLITKNNKVRVPSWLNPSGMDLEKWKEMGVETDFAEKQMKIIEYYKKLGVETTLTCTPYLIGHAPAFKEHIAWSESSAVVVANSFFGARTNREGAPSSLAAALTGYTSFYGLHVQDNRVPTILVNVETNLSSLADFSVMGYWFGELYRDSIPYFTNIESFDLDSAKMLGSAMAASGSVGLFHIKDKTPESKMVSLNEISEKTSFTADDKKKAYENLQSTQEKIDLVTIGCPHSSVEDFKKILSYLKDKRIRKGIDFWLFSSKSVIKQFELIETISLLKKKGVKIFTDTCMVVSPSIRLNYKNIVTNSAKATFYLSKENKIKVNLMPLEKILEVATE
ncbi:MAG: aconitase X catalytic domain-containing protein [Candidatus Heimdallarchaeaceae archaeon]